MGDAAAPPRTTSPTASLGKVLLHEVGHHPESTDAEKQKIDDLIKLAVFENAGRDSLEAGEALVAMGLKAAPRLINVFHTVQTTDGFDSRLGLVKAGVADGLLRKIDGAIDRQKQRPTRIMPASKPDYAQGVAKRWVRWWDSDGWKTPQKPWDERIDGAEKEGGEVEPGS
jgi:hypothetical protein